MGQVGVGPQSLHSFLFLINTLPQRQLPDNPHQLPTPCPVPPQKGAKRSTYSSKAHHWRSAIGGGGGSSGRAHLWWDVVEAGVGARAGE